MAPACVLKAQEMLGDKLADGNTVGWADLKAVLSGKEMNILKTTIRRAMTAEQLLISKTADKDEEAVWISHYLIDPVAGLARGFNSVTCTNELSNTTGWHWLTEKQIAKILNDEEAAAVLVASGELESRDHEYQALADKQWKQHRFYVKSKVVSEKVTDQAGVRIDADMSTEQYESLAEHMRNNLSVPNTKKRKQLPVLQIDGEMVALKKAKRSLGTTARKCKRLCDKVEMDVMDLMVQAKSVTANGYPKEMTNHLMKKCDELTKQKDELHNKYVYVLSKPEAMSTSKLAEVNEDMNAIDVDTCKLDAVYNNFCKGAKADIKRFASQ